MPLLTPYSNSERSGWPLPIMRALPRMDRLTWQAEAELSPGLVPSPPLCLLRGNVRESPRRREAPSAPLLWHRFLSRHWIERARLLPDPSTGDDAFNQEVPFLFWATEGNWQVVLNWTSKSVQGKMPERVFREMKNVICSVVCFEVFVLM